MTREEKGAGLNGGPYVSKGKSLKEIDRHNTAVSLSRLRTLLVLGFLLAALNGLLLTFLMFVFAIGIYIWIRSKQLPRKSMYRIIVLSMVTLSLLTVWLSCTITVYDNARLGPYHKWIYPREMWILWLEITSCADEHKAQGRIFRNNQWCDNIRFRRAIDSRPYILCPSLKRYSRASFIDIQLFYLYQAKLRKSRKGDTCDYALNSFVDFNRWNNLAGDMVFLFESAPGWNQVGAMELLCTDRHETKGCYILFLDGTVKFVRSDDIGKLNWGQTTESALMK